MDTSQLINNAQTNARLNTMQSQDFAREQMRFQELSNAKAMKFSSEEAKKNRDWQENMSNTSHQRQVADLIKAGLNPILSVNNGASTPSGSSASGVSSQGAKGEVDTGVTNLFSGLIQALVGQATALQTTSMNNMTSLESSKIGASAMLGTANINAKSNQYMQQQQIALEKFIKANYPQTVTGGISSLWNGIQNLLNRSNSSAKGQENLNGALYSLGESLKYLNSQDFKDLDNYGELGKLIKKFKK